MSSLFLFLNLIVIFSAIYFGAQGVVIFGLLGLLLILLQSLRLSEFIIYPFLSLVITTCIFYIYSIKLKRFGQNTRTELENIDEEDNLLAVELKHLGLENSSLKQKLHRYTTLKELTESLSSALSLEKTASLITNETFRIINKSNICLFYLVDRMKQELNLVKTRSSDPHLEVKLKKGDAFDDWVFKQHTRLLVQDSKKDFRFDAQRIEQDSRSVRALISAPLISENKLLGILRLDSPSSSRYDADDLRVLDIISDLAAVAIENTLLYQKMEKLAITDGLTGLFVHRHFQKRFDEETSRAVWTNSPFAFLMLDIDNFKNYNDRYGHIAGDILLKKIAHLIQANTSPGDIVARYGGEEFAILLVDSPKSQSRQIAEAIISRIEKTPFILRRQVTEVKVSGGIAFFPEDGKAKEELIARADQALYKAKLEGKNRLCTL